MAKLDSNALSLPAGGGPFKLERLTIGVFLTDQPDHRIAIGSDRSVVKPLKANEGWLLPAGCEGLCEYDVPLDLRMIEIDADLLTDAGLMATSEQVSTIGALDPLLLQMALMTDAFAAGDTLYRETMHRAFALQIARSLTPVSASGSNIDDRRLSRVIDHIHDHLADDLSLDGMAGLAAMSPSHFSHAFKKATGASPLQYVIGARVEMAKVLLDTTRLPVAEIGHRVGYADIPRFGQHFRKRVGITPARWRDR